MAPVRRAHTAFAFVKVGGWLRAASMTITSGNCFFSGNGRLYGALSNAYSWHLWDVKRAARLLDVKRRQRGSLALNFANYRLTAIPMRDSKPC